MMLLVLMNIFKNVLKIYLKIFRECVQRETDFLHIYT